MRRKIRAYLVLPHAWAVLVVVAATAAFGLLAADGRPPAGRFALLLLAMLGGQLAIGALNEYMDRAADAVAKPWKPIPAGDVSPAAALTVTALGLLLMLIAGGLLGLAELAVLSIGIGGGLAYDLGLKRTPVSWLPYLVALPIVPIWAWMVMDAFQPRHLWLYPIGALLIVAIHLAQVLPDIEADRERGERGLGVFLGERWATVVMWTAAFASPLIAGAGSVMFGSRPVAGMLAGAVVAGVFATTFVLHRRAPARVGPFLFQILTASAVVLGCGWVVASG
ncbi:MAG TPA: UbiA family prenyltransferase [Thermomicrobiales bacterium]|nr:UbiA family prenyltransferase [Thermomicrobiales bacterium]